MNLLPLPASHPWVERLGWTLLHFLWQGALIAVLYSAARRVARHASPNPRYLLACVALAAMAGAPLVTWSLVGPKVPIPGSSLPAVASSAAPGGAAAFSQASVYRAPYAMPAEPVLPWVVAIWLAGSIAFWLRLMGGWVLALRLRSILVRPAPREWQEILDRLKARIRVSGPVRLLVSSLVQAPTVVGWLRPVVLVPVGALTGVPAAQMEALLLHELAHIRRLDYLVNILQSAAEALLFYHPAVWWVSGHIRAERELCCDDVAVSATGDVLTYACALAELESSRAAHFTAALAATGGSLAHRIARLLGQSRPASRTLPGPGVMAGAILLVVMALGVSGQPAVRPTFDVISIKPSQEEHSMWVRPLPGGGLTATAPLRILMQKAYAGAKAGDEWLQSFQIVGGPAWIDSDRFEIEARSDGNGSRAQVFRMLQSLLEDRFQLKTHRETREMPVYMLVLTKAGTKLLAPPKEGGCVSLGANATTPPRAPGQPPPCGISIMMAGSRMRWQGRKVAMPELTKTLATSLGRPVIDKTGFTGTFDMLLDFTPDLARAGLPNPAGDPNGAAPAAEPANPSIFIAIQERLGLKLDSTKGPVEVMVIDGVRKPSGN